MRHVHFVQSHLSGQLEDISGFVLTSNITNPKSKSQSAQSAVHVELAATEVIPIWLPERVPTAIMADDKLVLPASFIFIAFQRR